MDIVLITNGKRKDLLRQTIKSLTLGSTTIHHLCLTYDGLLRAGASILDLPDDDLLSAASALDTLDFSVPPSWGVYSLFPTADRYGIGYAKNKGAAYFDRAGRGDTLMFLEDDFYLLPDWDCRLLRILEVSQLDQLGGWSHPYNHLSHIRWIFPHPDPKVGDTGWGQVDAVAGSPQIMPWRTWDQYGPFTEEDPRPGGSQDWAFSQKIRLGGGRIGCITPFVGIHCGITNSLGEKGVGAAEMEDLAVKQILRNHITGKVIVK